MTCGLVAIFSFPAIARVPAIGEGKKDRKSTRLNSSHRCISYAVFCLKKKTRCRLQQRRRSGLLHIRRSCDALPTYQRTERRERARRYATSTTTDPPSTAATARVCAHQ